MSSTAASREILLVCCCVDTSHQPRFARLACASAVKIGAQAGSPLTVAAWARPHAQQAILAHLDQPFRRRVQADHQWLLEMFKLVRQTNSRHNAALRCLLLQQPPKLFTRSHVVVDLGPRAAQQTNQVAMIEIALHRTSSRSLACLM